MSKHNFFSSLNKSSVADRNISIKPDLIWELDKQIKQIEGFLDELSIEVNKLYQQSQLENCAFYNFVKDVEPDYKEIHKQETEIQISILTEWNELSQSTQLQYLTQK